MPITKNHVLPVCSSDSLNIFPDWVKVITLFLVARDNDLDWNRLSRYTQMGLAGTIIQERYEKHGERDIWQPCNTKFLYNYHEQSEELIPCLGLEWLLLENPDDN